MMHYKIIKEKITDNINETLECLQDNVNYNIECGFEPYGGVSIAGNYLLQTVVYQEREDEE